MVILIALFAIQFRGTATVSKLFGPICVVWFLAIGGLGLMHMSDYPGILGALSPHHAVSFLASNGMIGLIVLGSVFLTVTGAEALTADMGHFGRFPIKSLLVIVPFLAIDVIFFGANILRVVDGGWVPLAVGALICLLIWIWVRGKKLIDSKENEGSMTLAELGQSLAKSSIARVEGSAVYLTANSEGIPGTILHNMKHNRVLHERNLVLTVRTAGVPHVPEEERATYEKVDANFACVILRYGFMDTPDVPQALASAIPKTDASLVEMATSYFVGRNVLSASKDEGLPFWQDLILIFLQRNAYNPAEFFRIPSNRIVALGTQVVV